MARFWKNPENSFDIFCVPQFFVHKNMSFSDHPQIMPPNFYKIEFLKISDLFNIELDFNLISIDVNKSRIFIN